MTTISTIFYYIFALISISYIFHLGFYLIGASLYDMMHQRRRSSLTDWQSERSYQPTVTVLVPAHNEEKVIVRCLDSIFKSTYRDISVIVANDASTDATRQILQAYKRANPQQNIRLIHKRINVGKGGALNYALRRYTKTELVMMVDADSIIAPTAIENAVHYFKNPKVMGVAANVQIMNKHTTLSILQKFEHLIGYRSKKAYSITNCEFVIGGVASTYRTDAIRSVGFYDTDTLTEDIGLSLKIVEQGNKNNRIIYGADIMALTEPVETFQGLFRQRYRWKYGSIQNLLKHSGLIESSDRKYTLMLTMYRLPIAVLSEVSLFLLPFVWAYAIYLTISTGSLLLIVGAYATVTAYTFMTLWYDEHLPLKERAYLTIYVPVAYLIYYIMDAIQVVAIIKCLFHIRGLGKGKSSGSSWVSPTRLGGEMKISSPLAMSIQTTGARHE